MKKLMALFIKRLATFGKSTLNEGKYSPKKSRLTLNISGLLPLMLLFAPVASHASYVSTFIDNGDLVTEIRDYGSYTETWEWLDLTITNGISYNSIVADLADDGALNNSTALMGYVNSIQDITGLTVGNKTGWGTVTDQGVVDLFNSFFGLTLIDDDFHQYNSNVSIVEEFIALFGDTYHEGLIDIKITSWDVNPDLNNIGGTGGITNSVGHLPYYNEITYVFDGQLISAEVDNYHDYIQTSTDARAVRENFELGTWLVRELDVVEVPEPDTFILFTLALMGLISGRFRQRKGE